MKLNKTAVGWLNVTPLLAIMVPFFIMPIIVVAIASIMQTDGFGGMFMDPTLENYTYVFQSALTYRLYFETIKFAALTLIFSAFIGFWVAYFLAFHVRTLPMQITLFMICTIPFWTSNVIRMISWIPLLGRNGLVNETLVSAGLIDAPIEWLLYSDFAVALALIHLYTLFMVVPIFNSMMRIDRSLIEAAYDAGASGFQTLTNVIIPLVKPGILIGSIFVVTIVTGDYLTIGIMGGQQIASVGKVIQTQINFLQFPIAAANAIVLLAVVLLTIWGMLRLVDIRKEL